MDFILIFIFILFLLAIGKRYYLYKNSTYVKSDLDGNYYLVIDAEHKQQSADTLAVINKRIKTLVENLDEYDCPPGIDHNIRLLKHRYKTFVLSENIYMQDTAFTINKSETMLCLRTRDSEQKQYDINSITFVAIHELTHVGCKNYGHGDEFVKFFIFLLGKCISLNLYQYINYNETPVEYCGVVINKTPV